MESKRVIFIMGAGHSGSTLLGLILSSHSKVFGLGELSELHEGIDKPYQDFPKLCFICQGRCAFWNDQVPLDFLKRYYSHKGILSNWRRKYHRFNHNPYDLFFKWTNLEMLVDFSKTLNWIREQLSPSKNWQAITPYLLFITRDGRAVVNSYLRKYPERTVEDQTKRWLRTMTKSQQFYNQFPDNQKMMVSYEQLTTRTAETVQSLCDFMQIEYEPSMQHYWEHDPHIVSSNNGTRSLIWRYRHQLEEETNSKLEQALHRVERIHDDFYEKLGLAIKIDLRWRQELSPDQIEIFDTIAGDANKNYAYKSR